MAEAGRTPGFGGRARSVAARPWLSLLLVPALTVLAVSPALVPGGPGPAALPGAFVRTVQEWRAGGPGSAAALALAAVGASRIARTGIPGPGAAPAAPADAIPVRSLSAPAAIRPGARWVPGPPRRPHERFGLGEDEARPRSRGVTPAPDPVGTRG